VTSAAIILACPARRTADQMSPIRSAGRSWMTTTRIDHVSKRLADYAREPHREAEPRARHGRGDPDPMLMRKP
jgi:hypothetical protein